MPDELAAVASRPLRVLHACTPTVAGVAVVVLGYLADQRARGWDVHLVCPPTGGLSARARSLGVTVHDWPATRSPGPDTVGETLRLARIVRSVDPDLVHLHSAKAGLAGRLAVRGRRPTLFQPHAWSFHAVTGRIARASLAWERYASRWTDLLVCVSDAERRAGVEAGVEATYSVIPNGVDLERFQAAGADERVAARERLGLPYAPLAVCVGRLCEQKGQDVLLAAWPEVRAQAPGARLALVGGGPDGDDLRRRAADLGLAAQESVLFTGDTDEVGSWLAAADVVVAPSRWEGMALVPLEAMALARSVVVTDVDGAAEAVPEACGAIVPVESVSLLADAVASRLLNLVLTRREGLAGHAHVQSRHDRRRAAAEVANAYYQPWSARRGGGSNEVDGP